MSFFELSSSSRDLQYGRIVSDVIRSLKLAVNKRVQQGHSQSEIASRIDMHPTQLSRILNARVSNLTLKTVSDVLWACDHEHSHFYAEPIEDLSPNTARGLSGHISELNWLPETGNTSTILNSYCMHTSSANNSLEDSSLSNDWVEVKSSNSTKNFMAE